MAALHDLTGKRFGRLRVISKASSGGHAKWFCECDCGTSIVTLGASLEQGRTRSCGCIRKANTAAMSTKHGKAGTREYEIWQNMHNRCANPKNTHFRNYGHRGVTVCTEWKTFERFYADMGDCPEGKTLERKDVNGPYSKANCVWATRLQQARNKRNTVWVTINGVQKSLSEWAELLGAKYHRMYDVLKRAQGNQP